MATATANTEKHDYCVQYRETAYDFICRLLEEEGICFYFLHDDRKHTVVFTDNNRGLAKCSHLADRVLVRMPACWAASGNGRARTGSAPANGR